MPREQAEGLKSTGSIGHGGRWFSRTWPKRLQEELVRAAPAAAPSNWSSRWPCPGARAAATEGRLTTAEQQEQQLRHVQQSARP